LEQVKTFDQVPEINQDQVRQELQNMLEEAKKALQTQINLLDPQTK
jgi:hypothetical protein